MQPTALGEGFVHEDETPGARRVISFGQRQNAVAKNLLVDVGRHAFREAVENQDLQLGGDLLLRAEQGVDLQV